MARSLIIPVAVLCVFLGCANAQPEPKPQVPMPMTLSILVHLLNAAGPLGPEAQKSLVKSSELTDVQTSAILQFLTFVTELENLERDVALARAHPNPDPPAFERKRLEILQTLVAKLKDHLGSDGWTKFDAFLESIAKKVHVRRSVCDTAATVYTFGTTVEGGSSVSTIAVADTGYFPGDRRLFAQAELRSPEGRELVAKSPSSSYRIHALAVATLNLGIEDGTYQGHFEFGELCGQDIFPRKYAD